MHTKLYLNLFYMWIENTGAHLQGECNGRTLIAGTLPFREIFRFSFFNSFSKVRRAKTNHGANAKAIQELVK